MTRWPVWAFLAVLPLAALSLGAHAQQTPAPDASGDQSGFKDDSFRAPPPPPRNSADDHVTKMPAARPGEHGQAQDMDDDDDSSDDEPSTPSRPNGGLPKDNPIWRQGRPQRGGWVPMGTATVQALDKINARAVTLTIKVGEAGHFGSLDIGVRGCLVRPPDVPADATAFLVVRDRAGSDAPVFNAWMVRSAPFMSMMAHPIYDLRVTGCTP
jgi:hypothetical protein